MVVFSVLRSLTGNQCVVLYLLLGGIFWWPCGEVSLVCEYYHVFICMKSKIVLMLNLDLSP